MGKNNLEKEKNYEKEETLKYIEKEDGATIWEINSMFDSQEDLKVFQSIFNDEQIRFIKALINKLVFGLDEFHNSNDSDAHPDIREEIADLKEKYKNHRHDLNRTFSAKPEE